MRIRKRQDRRKENWEVKRKEFFERGGLSIREVEWGRERRGNRRGGKGGREEVERKRTRQGQEHSNGVR